MYPSAKKLVESFYKIERKHGKWLDESLVDHTEVDQSDLLLLV